MVSGDVQGDGGIRVVYPSYEERVNERENYFKDHVACVEVEWHAGRGCGRRRGGCGRRRWPGSNDSLTVIVVVAEDDDRKYDGDDDDDERDRYDGDEADDETRVPAAAVVATTVVVVAIAVVGAATVDHLDTTTVGESDWA